MSFFRGTQRSLANHVTAACVATNKANMRAHTLRKMCQNEAEDAPFWQFGNLAGISWNLEGEKWSLSWDVEK